MFELKMSGLFDKHSLLVAAAYPHIRICYAQGKLADCRPLPAIFMSLSPLLRPNLLCQILQLPHRLFNFFLIIRPLTVPAALEFAVRFLAPQGAPGLLDQEG